MVDLGGADRTPAKAKEKLKAATERALKEPDVIASMRLGGFEPGTMPVAEVDAISRASTNAGARSSVPRASSRNKHLMPDLLAPGLDLVFCGTAPSPVSFKARAYYANPGNAFWPTLMPSASRRSGCRPSAIPSC